MNDQQLLRYSRHILLDELGIEAQQKFSRAHALVIGAGGLGAPAALYLAAAGVSRLTIADDDDVDLTNLQRQILYASEDVGRPKVERAKAALVRINPEVMVHALGERVDDARVAALVATADVVLDCSDNFATRHAINRACVAYRAPLVSAAAVRFDGQVSVFDLRRDDAPCYACLFPEEQGADEVDCATLGVFAPLTGMLGALMAGEALKCLAGLAGTLCGRLLMVDARTVDWHSVILSRDPGCKVCATRPKG